jgi:hypothetical protein
VICVHQEHIFHCIFIKNIDYVSTVTAGYYFFGKIHSECNKLQLVDTASLIRKIIDNVQPILQIFTNIAIAIAILKNQKFLKILLYVYHRRINTYFNSPPIFSVIVESSQRIPYLFDFQNDQF